MLFYMSVSGYGSTPDAALVRGCWSLRLVLVSCALLRFPWWVKPTLQFTRTPGYYYGVFMHAHAALRVRRRLASAHGCVLCGGVAGCCVGCLLFCTCVLLLTDCMPYSSYLCSGFFCATLDAYSGLCLVIHCTAPLDVNKSLTRMVQQHHHVIFPRTLRNALVVVTKHNVTSPNQSTTHKLLRNTQPNTCLLYTSPSPRD